MDDTPPAQCPECGIQFWLIWNAGYDVPEYCPFCGTWMDYSQAVEQEQEG